ncbi:MAG TPA: iron chelate uptake ABC transporter family permease subunit [Solirubrobacterales bacterium]|nr:iron chelate uptake ABC transporter family permease subunit [Solirubrobacterales bacterium]
MAVAAGRPRTLAAGLAALAACLALIACLSIAVGPRSIDLPAVAEALWGGDGSIENTVVQDIRVPRTLLGLLVGAALGLSGALLQGVTRNPLADPSIMGLSAGAAAFVVAGIAVLDIRDLTGYVWLGFLGTAAAGLLVYAIAAAGRDGPTPVKLALAGAAVAAGLWSLTTGIVMTNTDALAELRLWQVGSLAGRNMPVLEQVAPFLGAGLVLALLMGRTLNVLALGESQAQALGQRVTLARAAVLLAVAVLCGAATAACGPIVFVGLVVPHVARALCGPDYRWIIPYSLVLAPAILLAADVIGRLVMRPGELEVGVVLGVLGAPFFIALVRYRNLASL